MGMWDYQPWNDDTAADWFAEVMDSTGLAEKVAAGLDEDLEDFPEQVRAAAAMMVMLGRVYIWPVERLDDDLKKAVEKLEALEEIYAEDPELVAQLQHEKAVLSARLNRASPPDSPEQKQWWQSWQ